MSLSRRHVLTVIGGGVIVAATGAGAFLATRRPNAALAPWESAGTGYGDPRLRALSWAILAPNPHNRQPWQVRLDGETGVTLFADSTRMLKATDPYDRQITIGLGCFLEIARMAAGADGYAVTVDAFPEGESDARLDHRPVARLEFAETAKSVDPLFAQVPARRTSRHPFDMERPVPTGTIADLLSVIPPGVRAEGTADPARVAMLADLAWRGHEVEMTAPDPLAENVRLMRIGRAEIDADPDGISLGGPFLESLKLVGLLSRAQLADPGSTAYAQGMDMFRAIFAGSPAFVWMATSGNTRRDQLAAGAGWVRFNLAATARGLGVQPVSQTLQEYPEMTELHRRIHHELGRPGETVQMLGRLGHGPASAPSPRWPLDSRLVRT